jgi:hypothetical protein
MRKERRIFAPSIEEAETARRTDSLRKEQAAMNAPEEKKSQTGNARGDHVNGSGGRREPLLTSTPGRFRDDSDLQEPRHRLLNDADSIPEPSLHAKKPARGSSWPAGAVSFSTVAAILFLVWGGIELMPAPERIPIPSNTAMPMDSAMSSGLGAATRPVTSILIGIQDRQALVNEPIPLGGMLFGLGEEAVHITGLSDGSRMSAGEKIGPSDWHIPARDLAGVLVVPPASFVGTMRTVIQLRAAGNVPVDTQTARYDWVAKLTDRDAAARPQPKAKDATPAIPSTGKLDPQRSSQFVKRGIELMRIGDFAAARLVLRPAAESGDQEAALLLGATFDPAAIADLGALGLAPDPNVARSWYQRALDSGSTEAARRIERLTRASP